MSTIEISDAEAMIRILSQAADPTVEMPLADRKRAIMEGIARLVSADMWIWVSGRANLDVPGDSMVLSIVDGGWLDERERTDVFRIFYHPSAAPITAPLHYAVLDQRSHTVSRDQIMTDDAWYAAPFGQDWRATGFDHFVLSVYPVGELVYSGVGFHRRLGRPAFTERERTLVHIMVQQVDWLHRQGTDVPASERIVELSPRERQVMLLLLGGDSRKQVAAKLQLSEHTVADYLKEIYRKFGVKSRAELLAKFIPSGT